MNRVLCFLLLALSLNAQENYNIELVSNVRLEIEGNDIWGYVDESGNEYAILGADTATFLYSLTDPENPKEIAHIPGDKSIWRDFKTYGNFIYGVAYRGNDGFLIIDMSNAPEEITYTYYAPSAIKTNENGDTIVNGQFNGAHNLFIDEQGFIYLSDCPGFFRGVAVFQIGDNPQEPNFVTVFNNNLSHDIVVQNNKAFSADIFANAFSIWDVSDKEDIQLLGSQETGRKFTHNTWFSDDGQYLFTTDEKSGAWVESYDISEPSDIKFLDRIQVADGIQRNVIPHNTHYYNGFLVTSYYVDGVVIFDGSRPDNLIEVGRYDTYLEGGQGFHGCWGVYPWLPSGLLIASDIESGLFVLKPSYTRAAYLEGVVTDAVSGDPVQDVKVTIVEEDSKAISTSFDGEFKTGKGIAGMYAVEFYHPQYESLSIELELINGEVNMQNIALNPLQQISFSGKVLNSDDGSPIPNAQLSFVDRDLMIEGLSDDNGNYSISGLPGDFTITVGSWGFKSAQIQKKIAAAIDQDIELDPGYQDDFTLDLGWSVSNENVNAGPWERGIPQPTFNGVIPSSPGSDVDSDLGSKAYVTGVGTPGQAVGDFDLDDGTTTLTSPAIALEKVSNVVLKNYIWFYASERTDRDQLRNDTLFIQLVQGEQIVNIDTITEDTDGWELREYALENLFDPSMPFRIQYIVSDLPGPQQGNLVEAGIDGFEIKSTFSVSVGQQFFNVDFKVTPNPFSNQLRVNLEKEFEFSAKTEFILMNHLGQIVRKSWLQNSLTLDVRGLVPGFYLAFIKQEGASSRAIKLVK